MAKIKLEMKRVDDIKEYENNPRRNDKAVKAVTKSVQKFGYVNPIIVDEEGVILAGHTRIKALKQTGAEEVEVITVTHLTDQEKKSFRIADNRTHDFSEFDGDLLEAEMREIKAEDWEDFGFRNRDLRKLQPGEMCTCPKCGAQFVEAV